MLPVEVVKVLITAVIALNTLVARFPVTDKLEAVVDPKVDEPTVNKLPKAPIPVTVVDPEMRAVTAALPAVKFASVVDARVDDAPATKLVT